jgi:predicted nucleotidyltransferase
MLDLEQFDLGELCSALEDNSGEHDWWLDPATGELDFWSPDLDSEEERKHPFDRGWIQVEPIRSHEGYADMEDFTECVRDVRARELLARAIQGRGAFRRFKDTLFDLPELRQAWFRFHDVRMERRAIEWLLDRGLIEAERAQRAIAERADPDLPQLGGAFDPRAIAAAVATDLRELYGERLRQVVLFGSWARGDAHPESDIDLLVVLDKVESRWLELERMGDILWKHSLANDTVVTEIPVSEREFRESETPLLIRIRAEGVPVA